MLDISRCDQLHTFKANTNASPLRPIKEFASCYVNMPLINLDNDKSELNGFKAGYEALTSIKFHECNFLGS